MEGRRDGSLQNYKRRGHGRQSGPFSRVEMSKSRRNSIKVRGRKFKGDVQGILFGLILPRVVVEADPTYTGVVEAFICAGNMQGPSALPQKTQSS